MTEEFQQALNIHHKSLAHFADVASQIADLEDKLARLKARQRVVLEDIRDQGDRLKALDEQAVSIPPVQVPPEG